MQWWCSAVSTPWEWSWSPYLGVWLIVVAASAAYARAVRSRARATGVPVDRRKALWFTLCLVFFVLASDWPLGALGGAYLASAHMLIYVLYTLAIAPLLLLATPEWMARRFLERTRTYRLSNRLTHPLVAGVLFNLILVATHSPIAVDGLRTTQAGSFFLDVLWLVSGVLFWSPIVSPLPEHTRRSTPVKMVYLFLAGAVLPMIPGGILTFAAYPLYATFELAPRAFSTISAIDDQQAAGAIMKIGNLPVVWPVMAALFIRWATKERRRQQDEAEARNAERLARARAEGLVPPARP